MELIDSLLWANLQDHFEEPYHAIVFNEIQRVIYAGVRVDLETWGIMAAFVWQDTPQGSKFWSDLDGMAN